MLLCLGSRSQPEPTLGQLLVPDASRTNFASFALLVYSDTARFLFPVALPTLEELVYLGSPPLLSSNTMAQPTLRRLHLIGVWYISWEQLEVIFPALEHLKLSIGHDGPLGIETWMQPIVDLTAADTWSVVSAGKRPLPLALQDITVCAPLGDNHGGGCVVITEHMEVRVKRVKEGAGAEAWGAPKVFIVAGAEEYGQSAALRDWLEGV